MIVDFIVGLTIASILLILLWSVKGVMLTPISSGKNTLLSIDLNVSGKEPMLEQTIKGIIWLRENGTLKAKVHINTQNADTAAKHIARCYADMYDFITLL